MRILGVDDDLMARSMLLEALKLAGYEDVVLAPSGADALRKIQLSERPFDCFLLDIQMEDMDGIELCESIRQMPEYRETPIVMVTSLHEKRYVEMAFSAGATDYVTKPFDMMELGTRIHIAEKMSQKIKVIARNESELSKLRKIVESLETEPDDPSVDIAVSGFLKQEVFEGRLQQLSHADLVQGALVKCQIANFGQISSRCSGEDLKALLADVALAVGNVFEGERFLATYGGNGTFVILFLRAAPSDRELVQVQENLNQIRLSAGTGCSDFVLLDFGERIFCRPPTTDGEFKGFEGAQEFTDPELPNLDIEPREDQEASQAETPQKKLERRLKQMVPQYISVLNETLVHLEKLHETLKASRGSWTDVDEIERAAHKIAGVAPSLGFPELGAAAADVEKLSADAPRTKDLARSSVLIQPALGVLLDRIEDTIVENFV